MQKLHWILIKFTGKVVCWAVVVKLGLG